MCEKCGFSGCNHDWRVWQPKHYDHGYEDAALGRSANIPEGMLASSGYMAGFETRQREERNRLTRRAADKLCTCPHFEHNPVDAVICGWCGQRLS